MSTVTDDAIILQAFPYSETSKILRLLTASHGVRSAMARGALRPKSRYGGVLEPFTQGSATLQLKDGRELQTLTGFELIRVHRRLSGDLLRLGGASLVAEIVIRTGSEEPQPALHAHIGESLARLEDAPGEGLEATILSEVWALVSLLGFEPELSTCVRCGGRLGAEAGGGFDYAAGGMRCVECAEGAPGPRLPAHARRDLADLVRGEPVALSETAGHWSLLGRFLDYHVLAGGSLRSLPFLIDVLQRGPACGA